MVPRCLGNDTTHSTAATPFRLRARARNFMVSILISAPACSALHFFPPSMNRLNCIYLSFPVIYFPVFTISLLHAHSDMSSVMVLRWASRCLPGFSVLALMLLLVAAFPVTIHFPWRTGPDLAAPKPMATSHSEQHEHLTFAQKIFIGYLLFVHLNMLAFSLRLSFSLLSLWYQARSVLHRTRSDNYKRNHLVENSTVTVKSDIISSECSEESLLSMSTDFEPKHAADDVLSSKSQLYSSVKSSDELIHAIIVPNYREDFHTLFTTLSVLASHELAKSQYEVRPWYSVNLPLKKCVQKEKRGK